MCYLINEHLPVLLLALTGQQAQRVKVLLFNRALGSALIVKPDIARTRINTIDIGNAAVVAETLTQLGWVWQVTVRGDFDDYPFNKKNLIFNILKNI